MHLLSVITFDSLSVEMLKAALLRCYFEVLSACKTDDPSRPGIVSNKLNANTTFHWFQRLCLTVLPSDPQPDGRRANDVAIDELRLTFTQCITAELNAASRRAAGQAPTAVISTADLASQEREVFDRLIAPVLGRLYDLISAPHLYAFTPGVLNKIGRGAARVLQWNGTLLYIAAGVMLCASAATLNPALAAVAVGTAIEAAVKDAAGSEARKGLVRMSGGWAAGGTEGAIRYYHHLCFLVDSLGGNSEHFMSAAMLEDELVRRMAALDMDVSGEDEPSWMATEAALKFKLKQCPAAFSSPAIRGRPTLERCVESTKLDAVRFIRQVMCVRAIRTALLRSVYLSVVGPSNVGKSSFIRGLFGIPVRFGPHNDGRTLDVSVYPLLPNLAAARERPFFILDFPGTTDPDAKAAAAFYGLHIIVSLHIVIGKVVQGSDREREILDTIHRRAIRSTGVAASSASAQADAAGHASPATASSATAGPSSSAAATRFQGAHAYVVILNELENYAFTRSGQNGTPAGLERQVVELQETAATRIGIDKSRICLYWNELHWKDDDARLTQHRTEPHTRDRGTEHVKQFLVQQIHSQLGVPTEIIRAHLAYQWEAVIRQW